MLSNKKNLDILQKRDSFKLPFNYVNPANGNISNIVHSKNNGKEVRSISIPHRRAMGFLTKSTNVKGNFEQFNNTEFSFHSNMQQSNKIHNKLNKFEVNSNLFITKTTSYHSKRPSYCINHGNIAGMHNNINENRDIKEQPDIKGQKIMQDLKDPIEDNFNQSMRSKSCMKQNESTKAVTKLIKNIEVENFEKMENIESQLNDIRKKYDTNPLKDVKPDHQNLLSNNFEYCSKISENPSKISKTSITSHGIDLSTHPNTILSSKKSQTLKIFSEVESLEEIHSVIVSMFQRQKEILMSKGNNIHSLISDQLEIVDSNKNIEL